MSYDLTMRRLVLVLSLVFTSVLCARRTSLEAKQKVVAAAAATYSYTTAWYNQTLDHFTFTTDAKFRQKYLVNDTWWDRDKNGPIFFYTGNEGVIEAFAENSGFMWDIAPEFGALLIFAEHRYYGESQPFPSPTGGQKKTTKDHSAAVNYGYLTAGQALADFAELITYLKKTLPGAAQSPVIAFGGSYGGMLAAWLRIKFPHLCDGAIAASAPIAQFTSPCDAFGRIVTSDYTAAAANGTCSLAIRQSWPTLDLMGKKANNTGLDWINANYKLCQPLTHADNITQLKGYLSELWTDLAMMDYPYPTSFLAPLPAYPVTAACSQLTSNFYASETDLLSHIFSAASVYFNYTGQAKCLDIANTDDIGADLWNYQACSEMVMPFCYDGINDMFEPHPWNLQEVAKDCLAKWGVVPRPEMANMMFGGRKLEGASNIVFSNGLLDPWSSGSILKSRSPTVAAIIIPEGAHHLDLRASNPADPESVVAARNSEKKIIQTWIQTATKKKKSKKMTLTKDFSY